MSKNYITRKTIKQHISLNSKKLKVEVDNDYRTKYTYYYKLFFYENEKKVNISIETGDLESDFNDNDWDFIYHWYRKDYKNNKYV